MRARLHRFLLLLLMLALPLQAFASVSMLRCAFAHEAAPQGMAMSAAAVATCHDTEPADTPPAQHDCRHCAACCLATALAIPTFGTLAIMPVSTAFVAQPAAAFSGFIPDGPERPPRTSQV
jgi:hypothetical protein